MFVKRLRHTCLTSYSCDVTVTWHTNSNRLDPAAIFGGAWHQYASLSEPLGCLIMIMLPAWFGVRMHAWMVFMMD